MAGLKDMVGAKAYTGIEGLAGLIAAVVGWRHIVNPSGDVLIANALDWLGNAVAGGAFPEMMVAATSFLVGIVVLLAGLGTAWDGLMELTE